MDRPQAEAGSAPLPCFDLHGTQHTHLPTTIALSSKQHLFLYELRYFSYSDYSDSKSHHWRVSKIAALLDDGCQAPCRDERCFAWPWYLLSFGPDARSNASSKLHANFRDKESLAHISLDRAARW